MKHQLNHILKKAEREEKLSLEEVVFLLRLENPEDLAHLYQIARRLRRRYFENKVFLYGFLYLSTYCRNDCRFCHYRHSNPDSLRYRKNESEILEAARFMARSGVHLIDLTMGEDPELYRNGEQPYSWLADLISDVRQACKLPVMVSPGVLPDRVIEELARAGASWYACYQETFSQRLFADLRPQQNFGERLRKKQSALASGLLIEEGLLCGVGESCDDLADAIIEMGREGASQMRAMTFVPQSGTPMAGRPLPETRRELQVMAVLRLVYPRVLIPASLDVAGLAGLKSRLDAGANVVTSIVPPGVGLAGVAHPTMDIASARRTATSISAVLASSQLQTAADEDYRVWLDAEQKKMLPGNNKERALCALR